MADAAEFFKTAIVVSCNPKSATFDIMRTEGEMLYGVPMANTSGGIFSNDFQSPPNLRGAVVYYGYIDGCPYIFGTLPAPLGVSQNSTIGVSGTKSGAANTLAYGKASSAAYADDRCPDQQPNDKTISSDGGASITLMGDGSAALKVSPLCQLILGAGMDFIRLVARQFQLFTDFGSLEFSHGSSGRSGLTIKGGAEYSAESQAGSGTNTVFMHLGDTPDAPEARFGVRVCSVDGSQFGALSMGKDGKLIFATSENYLLMVGGEKHTLSDKDVYDDFRMSHAEKIGKNRNSQITGNEERAIGMKKSLVVGSDEDHGVGGSMNLQIGGLLNIGCDGINLSSANASGGSECNLSCSKLNITRA